MITDKNEVLIKVEGLEKAFGDLQVLKGINNEIHKGEVLVVIGPSGSQPAAVSFLRALI